MNGFLRDALFALAPKTIPLGLRQDILAALILHHPSLYSGHRLVGEKTTLVSVREYPMERYGSTAAHTALAGFFSVEVVLPRRSCDDLALLRDAKALGI